MKIFLNKRFAKIFTAVLLAALIGIFLNNIIAIRFIQDDVYTSFRYVKNFINGNGLVFNPGERVEGYTNFLWVVILSLPMYVGKMFSVDFKIEEIAQTLSIIFSCAVIIETYYLSMIIKLKIGESFPKQKPMLAGAENLAPVILMVYSVPLLYWGVSAMETSLFVSLMLLSIIFYLKGLSDIKPNKLFITVSLLNSLVRPEGIFIFGMIMTHNFLWNYFESRNHNFSEGIRKSFDKKYRTEIFSYLLLIFIFICFRMMYYGYPLPNTFYAKTEFTTEFIGRGWKYFLEFAKPYLMFGTFLIFPIVLYGGKEIRKEFSLLYGIVILWIIAIIAIGGDVLPVNRFFLPLMPIVYILLVKSIKSIIDKLVVGKERIKNLFFVLALLLTVVFGIFTYKQNYPAMMTKRAYEVGLVAKMKIYAEWVNRQEEIYNRKMNVAMSTIGAFSYYSDAHVIDLVGLTDSYIAHHPREVKGINDELPVLWKERHYNAQYILSKKPDYIIFPAGAKPTAFAECAVFVQPEFRSQYYTQIFYSDYLGQLLPVFTLRKLKNIFPDTTHYNCRLNFLKHYINADNLFLQMIESGNKSLLPLVMSECDSVVYYCHARKYDALTIKGYALYHAGKINPAEKVLHDVVQNDPYNSIAGYYLKDIYAREGKFSNAVEVMNAIKKYSPDALPYYLRPSTDDQSMSLF